MADARAELIEYLKTRRSTPSRNLGMPGPSSEEIGHMLTIAARVPDHGKLAPWRFMVYLSEARARLGRRFAERAAQLNPAIDGQMLEIERNRFAAPVVIGVVSRAAEHSKIPLWEQQMSAGAAAMNLLHAANAYGYDAQWLTEWIAFDNELQADLGVAEDEKIAGFIHIGTAQLPKTERDRPDLAAIVKTMRE